MLTASLRFGLQRVADTSARARLVSALAVATLACSPDPSGATDAGLPPKLPAVEVVTPGPSVFRVEDLDVIAQNDACERCHVEIAAEWQSSLHRMAWDDEVFLGAYVVEPIAFCRGCHAPEALVSNTHDPARHLGVACVTCHVVGHDIVGARAMAPRLDAHAVVASPAIRTVGWCESCHQFEFPIPQEAAMQSTIEEHASSPQAGKTCQTCHMPEVVRGAGSHRSHTFRVHGDPEMLRRSVLVTVREGAPAEHAIVASLRTSPEVGHAVPTGDMFRRLEVRARTVGDGEELHAATVVLAREFRMERAAEGLRRIQTGDSRVPADGTPRDAVLRFPRSVAGREVEWSVVYQRMGPDEARLFGVDLATEEVVVASGRLTVAP